MLLLLTLCTYHYNGNKKENMLSMFRKCYRIRNSTTSTPVLVLTTIFFILLIINFLEPPQHFITQARLKLFGNEISCYRDHGLDTLPDISDEMGNFILPNSIFFHETSCESRIAGRIVVTGRQACAVESAAFLHPNRKIYLLFTSPGVVKPGIGDDSDIALNALQSYENINLAHIDFAKYINNTPLEHLYSSGSIELSNYAGSHASDVLRYLTLWKYGGVYLDLDVVVTKSLDELGNNYAGSESAMNVAAGVLSLSAEGKGHQWAGDCLKDLSETFTGRDWGSNGPGVITRLLKRICHAEKAIDMLNSNCSGFKVMHPNIFYPIPWWNWTMYFDPLLAEKTMLAVKDSFAIHVWNKHSHTTKVDKDSAYAKVAKIYCPKVYTALVNRNF